MKAKSMNYQNLTQEKVENLISISSKNIELAIKNLSTIASWPLAKIKCKNLSTKNSPGLMAFTIDLYQTFKEETMSNLYKCFQKIEFEGIFSNSF